MNYPQVEYYITSQTIPRTKLNFEPVNWDEDDKRLVRNTESWGVFTELSNDLEFVKDGKELLETIYRVEGTETSVTLERFIFEDLDEGWELDYKGNLDMKTYRKENERVTVQFLTGGLQSLVESQFDEPYELERETDISGNEITELNYSKIAWNGRRIFLESLSEVQDDGRLGNILNVLTPFSGGVVQAVPPFPLQVKFNSEELSLNSVFTTGNGPSNNYSNVQISGSRDPGFTVTPRLLAPSASQMFYINQKDEENTFRFINSFSFKHGVYDSESIQLLDNNYDIVLGLLYFDFINDEWVLNRRQILNRFPDLDSSNISQITQGNNDLNLTVNAGEGVIYTMWTETVVPIQDGGYFASIGIFDYDFSIRLEQNSDFAPSEFNGIRLYDAVERMLEIYTGERNRIKSDYFNLGQFKDVLLTSGRYIRELEDARLSVELKDLYETNNYFNLGWSVETIDGKEKFVIEDKSYFFVDFPLFDLGEVSKLSISCASEFLYKSLNFGNKKAGDYEEVQGIQEYNAATTYQTHLKTADNKYDVEAKIRADLVGAELARRKNITAAPNEDTRYDNENFIFDCKPFGTDKFTPKVWQDQLDQQPICYDPPTAGNLLLTPFRSLERHATTFKAGLTKYSNQFTRYSSGTGDVNVATKLENEPLRYENGNVLNSDLENAIYEAEYYEFEKPLDLAIRRKLKGYTTYNEKNVPNFNFLVKFTYRNQNYEGWIVEVGFDNPGTWKLIKKNSNAI